MTCRAQLDGVDRENRCAFLAAQAAEAVAILYLTKVELQYGLAP
jgi:hypothetical protein